MRKIFSILISLYMVSSFSEPETLEVIFLSKAKVSSTKFQWSSFVANNFECVETEGGCFHPQLGFIEKDGVTPKKEAPPKVITNDPLTENSHESFGHDCDKNFHFDVFCGKETKKKKPSDIEIWLDVSASMRGVDFSDDQKFCERRYWVSKLLNDCQKKFDILTFNTIRRPLSILSDACGYEGTNNKVRMVEWIKASKAKHLLIVTDTEEYIDEFREYLDSSKATLYGIDSTDIYVKDISQATKSFMHACR